MNKGPLSETGDEMDPEDMADLAEPQEVEMVDQEDVEIEPEEVGKAARNISPDPRENANGAWYRKFEPQELTRTDHAPFTSKVLKQVLDEIRRTLQRQRMAEGTRGTKQEPLSRAVILRHRPSLTAIPIWEDTKLTEFKHAVRAFNELGRFENTGNKVCDQFKAECQKDHERLQATKQTRQEAGGKDVA